MTTWLTASEDLVNVGINFGTKFDGLLEEILILHEKIDNRHSIFDLLYNRLIFSDLLESKSFDCHFCLLEVVDNIVIECVVTPHADRLVLGSFLPTIRTGHWRVLLGVFRFDVFAVKFSVLQCSIIAIHRDVVRDSVTSPLPSLPVLDEALVLSELSEPGCVALPEVLWSNRFGQIRSVSGPLEIAHKRRIRHALAIVLDPQVGVVIVWTRMIVTQIPIQVRDSENHCDRSFAGFPIDFDLSTIFSLLYVTHFDFVEFAVRPESTFELDSEQSLIPGICGAIIDEGKDVFLPIEHVGLGRLGIIVSRGVGRHPINGVGWFSSRTTAESMLPNSSDREAIVALCSRVVVGPIDPSDDIFCRLSTFEGFSETSGFLSGSDGMSEQFLVTIVRVVVKIHLVRKQKKYVDILIRDRVVSVLLAVVVAGRTTRSDAVPEAIDSISFTHQMSRQTTDQDLTIWLESRPRLPSFSGLLRSIFSKRNCDLDLVRNARY